MVDDKQKLLLKPALELAKLIRKKKISSSELIEITLAKIANDNSQLNAVISTRKEAALKEVSQLEDKGQPFFGVPLLLKGLGQALRGEPETFGNIMFKNNKAQLTNNYVKALQRSGFIIIGQTNFPEFGLKNITDSKIYGLTRNPWDINYQAGGSSGGAGAVVADGMLPLAAGNDGGGSIRIPASWSGTIGLKPTRGRVPVGPTDWRSWQGASVNFALTRSVDDTAALLNSLQTIQPAGVFQVPMNTYGFLNGPRLEPYKVTVGYTTKSPVGTPVDAEAIKAVENAVSFLTDQGFNTKEIDLPTDGVRLMQAYYAMNEGETAAVFDSIQQSMRRELTINDMEPLTWALYQTGKNLSAAEYSKALNSWDNAAYQMSLLHEKYSVILTPATAYAAPQIDDPLVSKANLLKMKQIKELSSKEQKQLIWDQWLPALTLSPFTQQANLTGNPAISLPTHVTAEGLPLGIQFETGKGQEQLLLQIAKLFENNNKFKFLYPTNF
ncbi:amidase [Liquorilactobacillus mali]|uniref:Amidase n=1 Tax=Liquorilactobacillus mali TaxID=1618 RepID=A0A0R2FND5_9LACO|nr:amidase [Liquorilactobacillus mali]KRN30000.1 amidase [Liquorilactobacillus mali]MDN7144788.1 amidase [Liquorilactobacillus mali]